MLNYYEDLNDDLTLEINYDIKRQDPTLLSIEYSGVGNIKGAAHPNNLLYTTNIDINTGNKLRLKDFINIDKNLINKFINGSFKPLNPNVEYNLSNFSTEELLTLLKNADSLDDVDSKNHSDVFSYLTKDFLVFSIHVSHAAGDHAEFEIKLKDIKNNLNSNFTFIS